MAAAGILYFEVVNLTIRAYWQCGIWDLYQIWFKDMLQSLRSTHWCFWLSFYDVTRINFRFRLLVTLSSPHARDASSHKIWCRYLYYYYPELLTFFRNPRWRQPPSWIFRLCEFCHFRVLILWYLCSVPHLVQISVIVTEIGALIL